MSRFSRTGGARETGERAGERKKYWKRGGHTTFSEGLRRYAVNDYAVSVLGALGLRVFMCTKSFEVGAISLIILYRFSRTGGAGR